MPFSTHSRDFVTSRQSDSRARCSYNRLTLILSTSVAQIVQYIKVGAIFRFRSGHDEIIELENTSFIIP
jgi:hypothetical protein